MAVRASIHRARASGGDGVADPNAAGRARMKAVVTRRKLLDLARAQTDEVEFLRQELDRLRQKTFPSFAQHFSNITCARDYLHFPVISRYTWRKIGFSS